MIWAGRKRAVVVQLFAWLTVAACDGHVSVVSDPSGRADPDHPGATVIIGVNEQGSETRQPR